MCDMHLKLPICKILLHGCIESAKRVFRLVIWWFAFKKKTDELKRKVKFCFAFYAQALPSPQKPTMIAHCCVWQPFRHGQKKIVSHNKRKSNFKSEILAS